MIVADSPDVYGYTIFCDDIRVELGNKLTYVGAYHGQMTVQGTFPAMLPKFAIHVVYMQKRPNVIPPTKIIVVLPGATEENPSMGLEFPENEALQAVQNAEELAGQVTSDGTNVYATVSGPLVLINFVIPQPGLIKVRAIRGDQYIRLGSLRVIQDPNFVPVPTPAPKEKSSDGKEAAN